MMISSGEPIEVFMLQVKNQNQNQTGWYCKKTMGPFQKPGLVETEFVDPELW